MGRERKFINMIPMKLKSNASPLYGFVLLMVIAFSARVCGQEVGLQLYSLRNEFKEDVEGTLKQISDWGIRYLEAGDTYGMERGKFQGLLAKYGLEVVSIMASYEALEADPASVLENARSYGAKYVMCAWIPHKKNAFSITDAKRAVELFNKAGKLFSDNGITLAYHPHGYEFRPYGEGTLFDYMAKNAMYFKFEMDTYWVKHGGSDPVTLLKTYPEHFVLMHLKDMENGTKGNFSGHSDVETNVVLGTGVLEMAEIVKLAGELEIEYLFIEDESSRVLSQVPKSLQYLKSL